MIDRRKFLFGAASLFAGPAIVRSGILMPVKAIDIGSPLDVVAVSYFPDQYISTEELLGWWVNPWDFWYPSRCSAVLTAERSI